MALTFPFCWNVRDEDEFRQLLFGAKEYISELLGLGDVSVLQERVNRLEIELEEVNVRQQLELQNAKREIELREALCKQKDVLARKQEASLRESLAAETKLLDEKHKAELDIAKKEVECLRSLAGRLQGDSSSIKGALGEKKVESIVGEVLKKDGWNLTDETRKTRAMDLRYHKGELTIGIEVKAYDGNVAASEVDKFRRDRNDNKFGLALFISTAPVPNIGLKEENSFLKKDGAVFIYATNSLYISFLVKVLASDYETKDTDGFEEIRLRNERAVNRIQVMYKTFQEVKKSMQACDGIIRDFMEDFGIPISEAFHLNIGRPSEFVKVARAKR